MCNTASFRLIPIRFSMETRLLLNNLQEEIIIQEKKILKMEESFQIQMNHLKSEIDRLSHL